MLALGLQGSPRRKGNSDLLLGMFMDALREQGVQTHVIEVCRADIQPCKEMTVCEKKGICPIDDTMSREIYGMLRKADVVVAASPIFFYNVTAQMKALIDRCQTLWARKYMLDLNDPGNLIRRGFMLAVGATKGKQLFDGLHLTAKYFFDALAASYAGSLTYRGIEGRGDILTHDNVHADVQQAVQKLVGDLARRSKVIFACRENACRSQMAAAFARLYAGDRLDVTAAGSEPADQVNPMMVEVMQEKGIDMGFLTTQSLDQALDQHPPNHIITMGCGEQCPIVPGVERQDWELPDPAGQSVAFMRTVRDQIEAKVKTFIESCP